MNTLRPIFVDVGNTSTTAGCFPAATTQTESTESDSASTAASTAASDWWRTAEATWTWRSWNDIDWATLPNEPLHWVVASVSRPNSQHLKNAIDEHRPRDQWRPLTRTELAIPANPQIELDRVGADRLAVVRAANAIREPGRGAVVVDAGSAINVECLSPEGVFLGGAILPGMAISANALALGTDLLPEVSPAAKPPPSIGRNTQQAIQSGLFWGSWGAIQELTRQFSMHCGDNPHQYLTGGGILWGGLDNDFQVFPHLVLSGIALAWADACRDAPSGLSVTP